jgi:two-component system chemotaxis response regulator CheY
MAASDRSETILIVDDSSLCRDMIAKSLSAQGLASIAAVNGVEGLARLDQQHVDAIILDNEMPKMGGLAFLKAIRADTRWKSLPVLMLTSTVAKEMIVEAMKFGLSGYLLKSRLSMPDVVSRVRHALNQALATRGLPQPAAAEKPRVPNLVARNVTLEAVSQISEARTLAGVVSQIAALSTSPRATTTDIAAVVKQDPLLCVRVVQLACSAAYGGSKVRLGSVEDAVRTVGVVAVCKLASTMAVYGAMGASGGVSEELLRCWQHSLAVAEIMNRIVPKSDAIGSGLPYMVGLCHDLAEILLRQRFGSEFAAAADFAEQADVPTRDLVFRVFGIPYAELVEALLDRLKFPAAIAGPIKEYEFASRTIGKSSVLARSLVIANYLAHSILCTPSLDNLIAPILQNDCHTALIPTTPINLDEIRSESIMATAILTNSPCKEQSALSRPLLERKDFRVWYLRHPAFADLDPIESALGSLCQVVCQDRLPKTQELAGINGIVIAAPGGFYAPIAEASRLCAQTGKSLAVISGISPDADNSAAPQNAQKLSYPLSLSRLSTCINALGNQS